VNPRRWLTGARGHEYAGTAAIALLVSIAYYAGAQLGMALKFDAITPSVLWPPNAILTAVLLLAPPRRWPIYLLAALPAHLTVEMQAHWPTPLVLTLFLTNCSEALLAATWVRYFSQGAVFDTLRGVVLFIIGAGLVAPFVSSFPDAAAMAVFRGESYWLDWRTRFFANVLTELTLVPALVMTVWGLRTGIRNIGMWEVLERAWFWTGFLIVALVILPASKILTGSSDVFFKLPFVFFSPFLVWAAVRMGPSGTSLALLAVEFLAVLAGANERHSSQFQHSIVRVLSLQVVLMVIAIPLMCLAALIEERRRSEAIKSAILASLTSSVAVFDRRGRVISISEKWGHGMDGADRPGIRAGIGKTCAEVCRPVLPPDNTSVADAVLAGVSSVLEGARPRFSLEYSVGAPPWDRWFAIDASPLKSPEGGTVVSHTEITARKRMEIETKRTRDELAHFTRVSTMGALAASLAHELNQPLGAVLSNAEAGQLLLASSTIDGSQLHAILRDIVADTQRAGEVIRRLRALLRKGESSLQPLYVSQVANDVLDLAHSELITRNVTVIRHLAPDLPAVLGDRVQLQQVLLNLILNACDAMRATPPAERTLTVTASSGPDGTSEVSISDRGCGITPAIQNLLFEAFVTTKPQGLGLGLFICRSIIAAHGGRLWAENNADGGATFHFTLPVAALRAVDDAAPVGGDRVTERLSVKAAVVSKRRSR
jgi:signal transduction histidine kinase/integral membrane sensor domain MASE1